MKSVAVLITFIVSSGMFLNSPSDNRPETQPVLHKRPEKAGPVGTVSIIIDKSDYELSVYDEKGWYATYPVVFGNNSLDDKKMEGDKKTPEGHFHITNKKFHEKWHRFMGIDYPTAESRERFRQRKQRGEIPANASIGGSIGIHGTWPHEDFMIDKFKNWTMGCISMKNQDVAEIFNFIPSGTEVLIRK
jgi:murein L,D-transpeptidase YafK